MYYRARPPAHFHAIYGDHEITIEVASGKVNGEFPRRALSHVQEWRQMHRSELQRAWSLARSGNPLPCIQPLE